MLTGIYRYFAIISTLNRCHRLIDDSNKSKFNSCCVSFSCSSYTLSVRVGTTVVAEKLITFSSGSVIRIRHDGPWFDYENRVKMIAECKKAYEQFLKDQAEQDAKSRLRSPSENKAWSEANKAWQECHNKKD